MSGTDAQSDIESEYEKAKNTARAYLKAVGVLEPDEISMPEFRESQTRKMEDMLLEGGKVPVGLPDDPDGREAGMLAHRFLHGDCNPEILDTLFANEGNPAYRLALEVLKHCMRAMGADIPERLRVWKPDSKSVKERRWRREPIQHHLIGMVVEALVIGNNILFRWEKSKRKQERLQGNRVNLRMTRV